ncbi:hypothetical protein DAPPUDRAFT_250539 [Daphnia pulex]|uniref:Heme NO-binding domain-containing protein n=1 Tax=Daphnia pulex TaxID=6669 RepID=E9GYS8_DAPPU|nr:hypothetical protein DAPPUDRAFT_250539 [Daphnia pulex]|eukprot:EFX75214.1 hypothetical protein DAPPUDRAFT_250539 [Daphnia pulex]
MPPESLFDVLLLKLEYGEETWLAILESVGYRNAVFRTHHIYPDELIMKLADAAVTLDANGSTRQDFLRFFGRCFVRYFSHYGYEKFIKILLWDGEKIFVVNIHARTFLEDFSKNRCVVESLDA